MIRFINQPNLPKGKVKVLICGELCEELNRYLDLRGIKRIVIEPNDFIDSAVKYHADMAAIHISEDKLLVDKNQRSLCETLKSENFDVTLTENAIVGEYPCDVGLNFTIFGSNIMGKISCVDSNLSMLTESLNKINVKQGYCKCSCLVLSANAMITDDESVYRVLVAHDFDALLINKGDVLLEGHEYGFIGGASGKISEDEILFFGDITKHRDYKKIAGFIEKHGCKIISLDFPLTDFGGIIPIMEEV